MRDRVGGRWLCAWELDPPLEALRSPTERRGGEGEGGGLGRCTDEEREHVLTFRCRDLCRMG